MGSDMHVTPYADAFIRPRGDHREIVDAQMISHVNTACPVDARASADEDVVARRCQTQALELLREMESRSCAHGLLPSALTPACTTDMLRRRVRKLIRSRRSIASAATRARA